MALRNRKPDKQFLSHRSPSVVAISGRPTPNNQLKIFTFGKYIGWYEGVEIVFWCIHQRFLEN